MQRKTIYDVAEKAGVSISTVSRVINGKGYVSEETRRKVEEACENYRPIASAREIQSQKSKTIGIIINHETDYFFLNTTFLNVLRAITSVTKKRGYRLLIDTCEDENAVCNLYYECKVDGLIIMGSKRDSMLIPLMQKGNIPFVLVGDYEASNEISQVEINDKAAVYEAVKYLVGLGHRNIGIITGPLEYASGYNRLEGYKQALEEAGIAINEEYIEACDNITEIKAQNLAKKLLYLPNKITALMAFNDMVAVAAYKAAKDLGVSIPKDLSVIGFDDSVMASYVLPPLTTIWQPSYEKGERAINILIDALENNSLPRERIELKGITMYRESCVALN